MDLSERIGTKKKCLLRDSIYTELLTRQTLLQGQEAALSFLGRGGVGGRGSVEQERRIPERRGEDLGLIDMVAILTA